MERGALPELTGRRVSLSKSTHHSSEAGSFTLQAATHGPQEGHCQPSPCSFPMQGHSQSRSTGAWDTG